MSASSMPTCPACGAARTSHDRPMRGHSSLYATRELRSCDECGLRFAHPMPSDAEWAAYNASYFDNVHGGSAEVDAARPFHRGINRVRANHVEAVRASLGHPVRNVLEIGPGLGEFGMYWCETHPGTEYFALESDDAQRARLQASGMRAFATVAELPPGKRFDLVVLSHVLEHTSDPRAFLGSFVSLLNPGALVFIEVPCRDHEHKTEDEAHLLFFDREPMRRLLDAVGVTPVRVSYHGIEIDKLRGGFHRSFSRRVLNRLTLLADRAGLLPVPASLAGVTDAEGRSAVRSLDGHREKQQPSWWLRAVGRVNGKR